MKQEQLDTVLYNKVYKAISDGILSVLEDHPDASSKLVLSAASTYISRMVVYMAIDPEGYFAALRKIMDSIKQNDPQVPMDSVDPGMLN